MNEVITYVAELPIDYIQIILTVFTITTAIVSIVFTAKTYGLQMQHNKNSVRPILDLHVYCDNKCISIKLANNGIGPAIISGSKCYTNADNKMHQTLFNAVCSNISTKQSEYITFSETKIEKRSLSPESTIVLFDITEDYYFRTCKDGNKFDSFQKNLIRILKGITIEIEYQNIYNDSFNDRWNISDYII